MVSESLKQRVEEKIEQCYQIAERHFNRQFKRCGVKYDVSGRVAGYANYQHNVVRLNPVLLIENEDQFIDTTVPHEVAHLLTYKMYDINRGGRWAHHGPEWKSVMHVLGADPSRCHSFDTSRAERKVKTKYHYVCGCNDRPRIISSVIHNRIVNGRSYHCQACRQPIKMVQTIGKVGFRMAAEKAKDTSFVPPTNVTPMPVKAPRSGSKIQQCYEWFKKYHDDRETCIAVFVNEVGCTLKGATTYWYNCKKMYQEGI